MTDTVTVRVSDPPGPFAVNVYVVVLVGNTCRWPRLWTAPMPLSIDMSVALLMDQLSVDDWPFSMVDGSAVKLLMAARATVGGGAGSVWAGGGGGGGTFFLQPGATTSDGEHQQCGGNLGSVQSVTCAHPEQSPLLLSLLISLHSRQGFDYCLV